MHTSNMHYMHITFAKIVSFALPIKKFSFTKALTRSNKAIKMSATLTILCFQQGINCTYNDSHNIAYV